MLKGLLDPKIDFVFKNIFGSDKHPKILISFLNATLKPKYQITKVKIKNTDLEKHFLDDKFSRLDVKAETSNNEIKNELVRLSNDEEQRMLYEMRAKILKDKISALNKAKDEGREEGRRKEKKEIARKLIDILDDETISKKWEFQ
ncbi:PD-(D/E)XK nuclease family transposase [Clostridium sp. ZS2-4]|uniref:PD-(D/E)XK nuclease family transposase n=1 Tax=Clostridium sp. ZS2-4 TaxID=2987703 RepID=UPI00227A8ABE|nr:PD-(D/E)XK nuclease family transposase [Clostridium sp. ZS2-4]MCY6354174.1 PD-(D/E)XK nuclease family transposase [Clostridium sp. ZS2-4]